MPAPDNFSLRRLLRTSRPRFWMYVFGPYLVGLAAGASRPTDLLDPLVLLFGVYFLFPANLLIYGVNDIFDYETDIRNAKKSGYEDLVQPDQRPALWRAILWSNAPFAIGLFTLGGGALAALGAFYFFSIFYSAPPIRAKARPLVDSAFNVLYVCPGVFAYLLIGGQRLDPLLVLAASFWAMAMHAYSAVPDIRADRDSGLATIATLLGFHGTLAVCLTLFAAAGLLASAALPVVAPLLAAVYVVMMILSMTLPSDTALLRVYARFPLINTLCGMVLFFAAATSELL